MKQCPHCKQSSGTGTHGGCYTCGKVKHTYDGRKLEKEKVKAASA